MSVQISLHAISLKKFLIFIRDKRSAPIKEANLDFRVLNRLDLTGIEDRPFTNEEIRKVLYDYKYFKDFFTQKGLWPYPEDDS